MNIANQDWTWQILENSGRVVQASLVLIKAIADMYIRLSIDHIGQGQRLLHELSKESSGNSFEHKSKMLKVYARDVDERLNGVLKNVGPSPSPPYQFAAAQELTSFQKKEEVYRKAEQSLRTLARGKQQRESLRLSIHPLLIVQS